MKRTNRLHVASTLLIAMVGVVAVACASNEAMVLESESGVQGDGPERNVRAEGYPAEPADPEVASPERAAGDLLLVAAGSDFETLAVLDLETRELTAVTSPTGVDDATPRQAVVGPTGDHVLIIASDGLILWDRSVDETKLLGYGGRILGIHPGLRPALVLVKTNDAILLVDLLRGSTHDLTEELRSWPAGVVPALSGDESSAVVMIASPGGGAVAVDLETASITRHSDELLFFRKGLSPDGAYAIAGRSSEDGLAIEALDPFDPSTSAVWYTPEAPETQVTVAWSGDHLFGVDLTGRVMTMTDGTITELGRMREPGAGDRSGIFTATIYPDLSSSSGSAVLVEERGSGSGRWFRVDSVTSAVEELTAIEGHTIVSTALTGHLVVGIGEVASGFSTLRVVDMAEGANRVLLEDPSAPLVVVQALSDSVVGLTSVHSEPRETRTFDMEGRSIGVIYAQSGIVIDQFAHRAAYPARSNGSGHVELETRIVAIDGSVEDIVIPDVVPLAWLPAN